MSAKPKLNVGKSFRFNGIDCLITAVDSFGVVLHYGFTWSNQAGDQYFAGWIPCQLIDPLIPLLTFPYEVVSWREVADRVDEMTR